MKTKNNPLNPKKIPYYLTLILLTAGASLILGFLSFGGMYALMPVLSLAFAAFGLSVAYEGEIYLQNIKGALNKLLKSHYLQNHLAKEFLLNHFPQNTSAPDCPEFFRDYEKQLKLLEAFNHKKLTKESKKQKKQIEKTLKDMEKWFALHLSSNSKDTSPYIEELRLWLANNKQDEWLKVLEKRRFTFNAVKVFSTLSAVFMGLGSTYLIAEAFSVIPLLAGPLIIVPMAVIAGTAYGLLTYNTITDLINNDTLNKWYKKIRDDLREGLSVRNVFMATMAIMLVGLAVALTICTAGTWWTVATSAHPVFDWMRRMPNFIMDIIAPLVAGLSAISFNIENTAESLEMLYAILSNATHSYTNIFQKAYRSIANGYTHLRNTENWWQIVNPFRLILKLTITPLRLILFLGHLISIALTADRMPGVPKIVSALIAIISEGFEDAHYFVGNSLEGDHDHHETHEHSEDTHTKKLLEERLNTADGHSHDADIPTRILKLIALPLYILAAGWDCLASKRNTPDSNTKQPKILSFTQAWKKQQGIIEEETVDLPADAEQPSKEWQIEHTISLIDKYEAKHFNDVLVGTKLADEKKRKLGQLKADIRLSASSPFSLADKLEKAKTEKVFNQHRLFAYGNTCTQEFIEELPQRINVSGTEL